MKKINFLKYITATITVVLFALVLKSCKKADIEPTSTITTGLTDLDRAKAHVKEVSKQWGGLPEVFPVQQKMDMYWVDPNGVRKDPKTSNNSFGGGCSNYDLPDYATLLQYQRIYRCDGPGYLIQYEYNVSWNKPVVYNNTSSGVSTAGYISVWDNNGDVFVTSYNVNGSDVAITDLGVDINNASNHIYNVKFSKSTVIPTAYVNGDAITTYTIRIGATFVTSCPLSYSLYIVPAKAFGFVGGTGLSPCDRNDRPIFQPPSIFTGQHKLGISGYDPTYGCSEYTGTFTRTDLQQVQYSLDGGSTWSLFPNATVSTSNTILSDGFIFYNDFAETPNLTPGTYTVILRFKNWRYASGFPSPLIDPDVANGDCHSWGNPSLPTTPQQLYAEWAYEFWPNITIQ